MSLSIQDLMLPWWRLPIVVIDFETTGVDPRECLPVEIAIARVERGEVVGRWSTLINIGDNPIPAEASAVHGITSDMLVNAPDCMTQLMSAIRVNADDLLRGAVPCGYNGQAFDRIILHRWALDDIRTPATCGEWPWIDPLVAIRIIDKFVGGKGRHKLSNVCERRGVKIEGAHRAMADVEATAALLFHDDMRKAYGDLTVLELLRRQAKHAEKQDEDFRAWLAKQPPRADDKQL